MVLVPVFFLDHHTAEMFIIFIYKMYKNHHVFLIENRLSVNLPAKNAFSQQHLGFMHRQLTRLIYRQNHSFG
jgi:hypothetical protein